ncbi:MAG: type III-B CRISPR module RAMP protein Cmr6 [Azoarcus sp.]|jgi:CRISPR-associated protein Cmr6|nr:type III-B CRISPR module RAMP protein Cmr6 [Azoarcus sp.]
MAIAALPQYLGQDFKTATPGLRFGMYLQLWGRNSRTHQALWTTHDINYRVAGRDREEREFKDENKTACLKNACALTDNDKRTFEALGKRQEALAQTCGKDSMLIMDAQSIAPFSTGLGNEHPLENGFAFLNPYGLPYLPGSGVKGVLRQAVKELASGEWGKTDWSLEKRYPLKIGKDETLMLSALDVLFGYETPKGEKDHVRGVLSFWDVIPQIKGDHLAVDIMTPHQSHYYQNKASADSVTPHESGQPKPISFLTVPPKSGFVFYVQCDVAHLARLAPELTENDNWRKLLEDAFQHAFDWLGFGAKTSVGYGAMESGAQIQRKADDEAAKVRQQQQESAQEWNGARVKFNAKNGALSVEKSGKTAIALAPKGEDLLNTLPTAIQQKIKSGQFVKLSAFVAGSVIVSF